MFNYKLKSLAAVIFLLVSIEAPAKIIENNGKSQRYLHNKPLSHKANSELSKMFLLRADIWAKIHMQNYVKTHKPKPLTPTPEFAKKYNLLKQSVLNNEMITASKKQRTNNRHVIFLHGGYYLYAQSGLKNKQEDLEIIMKHLGDRVTYVDYPSTQTANYKEIRAIAKEAYLTLLATYPNDEFILVGNSAGANMALGLGQQLKAEGTLNQPTHYILISPWTDMSTDDPEMALYEFYDPILSRASLKYGADLFRAGLAYKHPQISPLYGNMKGLGKIAIFSGTFDLTYPSSINLYKKAQANGLHVHHYQYNKMWHDWMLYLDTPEAHTAWKQASEFVK